jgi:hypothetical protein
MGAQRAGAFVHLLNDRGDEVNDAFLPLDVSFWNADHTRYTLLFDPGRVKRGIRPNIESGRPLVAGRRYTLVIDRAWRDAHGHPLVNSFRRTFRVDPAVFEPIEPAAWRVNPPVAATERPLTVSFPRPLDHAILQKALLVIDVKNRVIDGDVAVDDSATHWTFTPRSAWVAGDYWLRALPVLEDPAGNRIGRAFDFDPRHPSTNDEGEADAHAEASIAFRVSATGP